MPEQPDPESVALVTTRRAMEASGGDPHAIIPRTFLDVEAMSLSLSKSTAVPQHVRGSAHNVAAIIMSGGELGLPPMAALRSFHSYDGKTPLKAEAMVAIAVRRPDVCKYVRRIEANDKIATYETFRVGHPEPSRISWKIEEVPKSLTGKANWQNHPRQMLAARCKAELMNDVYPDLMLGIVAQEVVDDGELEPPPVTVFTAPPAAAAAVATAQAVAADAAKTERKATRKSGAAAAPTLTSVSPATGSPASSSPANDTAAQPAAGVAPAARSDYDASVARVREDDAARARDAQAEREGAEARARDAEERRLQVERADAARKDLETRAAATAAAGENDDAVDAEEVESESAEDVGFDEEPAAAGDPPQVAAFFRDLAACKTIDKLKELRAGSLPWAQSGEGKPYFDRMRAAFKEREAQIRSGK